jgi:polyhydroxyalkanoate synthesis regulator phasin
MAEDINERPNRAKFIARFKQSHPDTNIEDEETLYGVINDDYDKYDTDLNDARNREQAMVDLYTEDPRTASLLTAWKDGEDPLLYLIRNYGDEFLDALRDEERQEEFAKAYSEYLEKVAKSKEFEEQYQGNLQQSIDTLDQMVADGEISAEDCDEVIGNITNTISDGIYGKFDKETILMYLKALHHDEDVAEADYAGEVRGRNSKIEEKLRKGTQGDGTASIYGRNGGRVSEAMPDLGAIDQYRDGGGNSSIWERGGEKRTTFR